MSERTFIHVTDQFALQQSCRALVAAFGWCIYHVGSSIQRRDWFDVDVRCILDDEEFARMFPEQDPTEKTGRTARLSLLNAAVSEWLKARTGLPVDFQFQQMTAANEQYPHRRNALGVFPRER